MPRQGQKLTTIKWNAVQKADACSACKLSVEDVDLIYRYLGSQEGKRLETSKIDRYVRRQHGCTEWHDMHSEHPSDRARSLVRRPKGRPAGRDSMPADACSSTPSTRDGGHTLAEDKSASLQSEAWLTLTRADWLTHCQLIIGSGNIWGSGHHAAQGQVCECGQMAHSGVE